MQKHKAIFRQKNQKEIKDTILCDYFSPLSRLFFSFFFRSFSLFHAFKADLIVFLVFVQCSPFL